MTKLDFLQVYHWTFKIQNLPIFTLKSLCGLLVKCSQLFHEVVGSNLASVYYNTHVHTQACMCACMCMYTCMYILKIQMTSSYDNGQHMATIIDCVTWSYYTKKNNLFDFSIRTNLFLFIRGLAKFISIHLSKFTKNLMEHLVNSPTFLCSDCLFYLLIFIVHILMIFVHYSCLKVGNKS
jgi:hypothetical protein